LAVAAAEIQAFVASAAMAAARSVLDMRTAVPVIAGIAAAGPVYCNAAVVAPIDAAAPIAA
jgi:Asp/Glu/hydantoin racemase